jgi:two-component system chemotaxis sensor kinase CheA
VEAFIGQQEIVLKSLSEVAGERKGLAGATVMADGSVGLVVDIAALLEHVVRVGERVAAALKPDSKVA